jgi:hypothetical protein
MWLPPGAISRGQRFGLLRQSMAFMTIGGAACVG